MFEFRLKINWSLFPRVLLKYSSISSDNGLALFRRQAIIWNNAGYWPMYANVIPADDIVITPIRHEATSFSEN